MRLVWFYDTIISGGEEMKSKYYTVAEIADNFKVSETAVRKWIEKGLKYKTERVLGLRERKILKIEDVEKFLNRGVR